MGQRTTNDKETIHSSADGLSAATFRTLLQTFASVSIPLQPNERRAATERQHQFVRALIERDVPEPRWRELMHRAREAAERGEHEFLLLRFPLDACSDGGRAITQHEPGWQKTLTGDAASMYRHWREELSDRGFGPGFARSRVFGRNTAWLRTIP